MRTPLLVTLAGAAAFAAAAAVTALAAHRVDGAAWGVGDNDARIFRAAGDTALQGVAGTIDLQAGKTLVSSGSGGNFEFEHNPSVVPSTLRAETPTGAATPLQIGLADGQDVTPLLVTGNADKTTAVQSWQVGGSSVAAIDPSGALRANGIRLVPRVGARGRVTLVAILPNGSQQRLVPVSSR